MDAKLVAVLHEECCMHAPSTTLSATATCPHLNLHAKHVKHHAGGQVAPGGDVLAAAADAYALGQLGVCGPLCSRPRLGHVQGREDLPQHLPPADYVLRSLTRQALCRQVSSRVTVQETVPYDPVMFESNIYG